jgi:NTE family protein
MRDSERFVAVSVLILLLTGVAVAGPCPEDRECVALVLAGGGARGAAHVGVIEVMEELHVPVDFIVGTSMGAIIGGMYASGLSPEEMREKLAEIDWEESFNDDPPRRNIPFRQKQDDDRSLFKPEFGFGKDGANSPRGLVAGQKLNFILAALLLHTTSVQDFDELPIPFRAIAVDLNSGEVVVQDRGSLPTAIRASMAYPVFFTPVEVGDQLLVDGGVLRNMPVDVAIEMGADRMIAIDVGSPFSGGSETHSAFKVARRTLSVMTREGRKEQEEMLREQDLLIVPDLEGVTAFEDFTAVGTAIERGVDAARANAEALEQFAVDEETFAEYIGRHRAGRKMGRVTIDRVEVTGLERISPKRVKRRLESQPGTEVDVDTLQRDLEEVYRIGELEQVGFDLRRTDGETVLVIEASEKSWGPWFYRLGASALATFDGRGDFTANVLVRRPNINRLGGEWKTFLSIGSLDKIDTDFYQPLEYTGSFFVSPRAYFAEDADERIFLGGLETVVESRRREWGLDIGTKLFSVGELRVGALQGRSEIDPRTIDVDPIDADTGGWRMLFNFDGLDNANFPRRGTSALLELYLSRRSMGADLNYDRLFVSLGHAWKMGNWTQIASADYGTDLDSGLPAYDWFRLGGFLNLSGLRLGEVAGPEMGQLRLITYRKTGKIPSLFGGDLYLGASLEAGNAWFPEISTSAGSYGGAALNDLRYAGSVFAGVDTLFGPLYLAYGISESSRSEWYLFLGRIFGADRFSSSPRIGG